MKLNKLYIFLAVILTSMSMTACFDDQGVDTIFDGGFVEFEDGRLPNGRTASFIRLTETQEDMVTLQVNRVSTVSTSPITINIEVDPASTAVSGVHYSLATQTVTIPAGEFIATFDVKVLTGNIDPSETPDLMLLISSADGAEISSNYGDLTVAIRTICPSDLAGTYTVFYEYLQTGDSEGGPNQTATNFVIAAADEVKWEETSGAANYLIDDMSFGMYPGLYGDAAPSGRISDSCNELTGDSANVDQYGDPFTISGVVNEDGTISLSWSNTYGDGGDVILTKK